MCWLFNCWSSMVDYCVSFRQQMSFHERKTCSSSTIIQRNNTKFPLPLHRRILCDTRFRAVPFSIHPNKTKTYNFNEEKNKKCQTDQTLIIIFYYYINVCVYCRDSRREDVIPHAHCTVSSKCVRIHANKLIFSSSDSAHPTTATQHTHTRNTTTGFAVYFASVSLSFSLNDIQYDVTHMTRGKKPQIHTNTQTHDSN